MATKDLGQVVGPAGPKGDTGSQGIQGPTGPAGPKGDTGSTGPAGSQGPKGDTGAKGDTGDPGPGVATGGAAGQFLKKHSSTNYDTEWATVTGAGLPVSGSDSTTIAQSVENLSGGIAIVAVGNTHDAIAQGQYVYIREHGTLAEGLYKATAAIATNGTLSVSNVSAVSGGLGAEVSSLNSKTVVLPWGTYGENTHQLTNSVSIGKTVKIMAGANGRYVQYFTISGWGDSEQTAFMTDSGIILASFTDSTHIYVRGTGVANNPVKIIYLLDGLVL